MKSASVQNTERIASLLRQRRVAMGLKQTQAAEMAGVAAPTLRLFEQTGQISLERLMRLCRVYRMDTNVMSGFESREWWSLEEIKDAETKRTVR